MNPKTKSLRLFFTAVLAVAGISAATTLAVGGAGTGSSSTGTGTQSVGGGSTPVHTLGVTDFILSVSDGDKGENLTFLTSRIRKSNGSINVGASTTVTITKPDNSTFYFIQKTDADGRVRAVIDGAELTQVGSYDLSVHVWSGKTASDTFSIREKLFKDLDDQVVTGRRQHFRNRTNDTNAFSIEDASGDSLFSVDTLLKTVLTADLRPKVAGNVTQGITTSVIDSTDYAAEYGAAITLGADGFSRIASSYYGDGSTPGLAFTRCHDADCAQKTTSIIPDASSAEAYYVTLKIGSDGFARIVYNDSSDSLTLARCTNADCTSPVVTQLDNSGSDYATPSIAFGSDGFLRIAYQGYDNGLGDYATRYVTCQDADCTARTDNFIDTNYANYNTVSMVLSSDGFARVIYVDNDNSALKFARCTDEACTAPVITTINDNSDNSSPGYYGVRMLMAADGLPRIAAVDGNGSYPVLFHRCLDQDCATRDTVSLGDSYGSYGGLGFGLRDDQVWASYEDFEGSTLAVHCDDASCTSTNSVQLSSQDYAADYAIDLVTGSDDLPRIVYAGYYDDPSPLRFVRLGTPDGQDVYAGTDIGSESARFNTINALQLTANKLTAPDGSLDIQGGTDISGRLATGNKASLSSASVFNLNEEITDFASTVDGITNTLSLQPSADGEEVNGVHTVISNIGADNHNLSGIVGSRTNIQYSGATAGFVAANADELSVSSANVSEVSGNIATLNLYGGSIFKAQGFASTLNINFGGTTNAWGGVFSVNNSGGNISNAYGNLIDVGTANGTVNNVTGILTNSHSMYGTGLISNNIGININTPFLYSGGQITNNYGLRIEDQSSAGSSQSYNLYSAGANAKNYFAGKLSIGTTDTTYKLTVSGDVGFTGKLTVTDNVTFSGATLTLSSNMRGINIALGSGVTTKAITFGTAHADANYLVDCTPSWNTTCWVTNKTTSGFTLNFGTATSDANQKVDWLVVR